MASNLSISSIAAPGFYGINTQDSPTALPKEFSLVASNAVIDSFGRLAARKGWEAIHSDSEELGTNPVMAVSEYVTSSGATELIVVGGTSIFLVADNSYTLTRLYSDTSWTGSNWKIVNFNDKMYFFQKGNAPLVYDGSVVQKITAHASYDGTVMEANEVLSAYGRLWTADTTTDRTTIKWSDTLVGEDWTGGASGTLNMETIFTNGTTPIVALAAFNGYLVVFCEQSIAIFQGVSEDPSTNIALVDVIDGIGCIARDSVIDVGSDILFLSNTGVRSLGRVIDQKSAPLFDTSQNVRDALMADVIANQGTNTIKAGYSGLDGVYILSLASLGKSYVFDLKRRLDNNVCRVTTWELAPYSICWQRDNTLVFGFSGKAGKYYGYSDNGSSYRFLYRGSYWDYDNAGVFKILKQARLTVYGGTGYNVAFRWGLDYDRTDRGARVTLNSLDASDEYNVDEYGIAKYSGTQDRIQTPRVQLSGAGRVYQLEIETNIFGYPFSIQSIDVFAKTGRVHNI